MRSLTAGQVMVEWPTSRRATEFIGAVSARLTWKYLPVMVTLGNGDTQTVLKGLTGFAEPDALTAFKGPTTESTFAQDMTWSLVISANLVRKNQSSHHSPT